jgi:hypothetical protein
MKRIAESELTRAALAKGAVVSIDGRTVNAAGSKMTLAAPKPAAPPILAAPPPPMRVEMDTAALLDASRQQAEQMGRLVSALITEMRAQRDASPAPIKAWEFEVRRDDKDRLQTLRATAIR